MSVFDEIEGLQPVDPAKLEEYRREMEDVVIPALVEKYSGRRTPRSKACHVGAPAIFALELACKQVNEAFCSACGCYLVGSALDRPDWRDVDVRCILPDDEFLRLFPGTYAKGGLHIWEQDARWLLMTVSVSAWMSKLTGLPVDFQFQPQTHANERHGGKRSALGMTVAKNPKSV